MFKPTLRSVIQDVTRKDTGRPILNSQTITKIHALLHVVKSLEIESIISLIDGAFPAIGKTFDALCVVLDTLTGVSKKDAAQKKKEKKRKDKVCVLGRGELLFMWQRLYIVVALTYDIVSYEYT